MALTAISLSEVVLISALSDLLYAIIYGIFFSLNRPISSLSISLIPYSEFTTRTAISVDASVFLAASTRISPSLPSSSKPGVSIIRTGPIGKSSIAFLTGSVVVPATSDTTDSFCPVTALTRLDFPAFLIPKNPI